MHEKQRKEAITGEKQCLYEIVGKLVKQHKRKGEKRRK